VLINNLINNETINNEAINCEVGYNSPYFKLKNPFIVISGCNFLS